MVFIEDKNILSFSSLGLSFREELGYESITGNASGEEERIKCLASDSIWFVESVSLVEEE